MWQNIIAFYKENLQQKVREGLKLAAKAFMDTFWTYIREDVILSARKSLKLITALMTSPEAKEKKEAIIDLIMLKIKLPIVLRPFKFIVRNMISNKIDEVIKELLGKGLEVLG